MAAAPTRTLLRVAAVDVKPGDELVDPDLIPIRADFVSLHAFRSGFVVVDYTIPGTKITGSRTFALATKVAVLRNEEGAH